MVDLIKRSFTHEMKRRIPVYSKCTQKEVKKIEIRRNQTRVKVEKIEYLWDVWKKNYDVKAYNLCFSDALHHGVILIK